MKTFNLTPNDIKKNWVLVDAADQTVGRLASEIARVLRGKNKPTFSPHLDTGDFVVVVNADKIKFTGNKMENKVYYHHTGYIGGIKARTATQLMETFPERVLKNAVKGMLPKNKIGRKVFKNLKVYAGVEHPHAAQNPVPMAQRTVGVK